MTVSSDFATLIEARKACCYARKVQPLRRSLAGSAAWITGLRRGQSAGRAAVPFAEWDATFGLVKVNPIADWTAGQLDAYIAANDVPVNPLHAQASPPSAASPARAQFDLAKTPAQGAGGGRMRTGRSAACTRAGQHGWGRRHERTADAPRRLGSREHLHLPRGSRPSSASPSCSIPSARTRPSCCTLRARPSIRRGLHSRCCTWTRRGSSAT